MTGDAERSDHAIGPAELAEAIHDGPIQALTTAILHVGRLARECDPELAEELLTIEQALVSAGDQLRELMQRLVDGPPA